MLHRLQKSLDAKAAEGKDKGFTLVELLVVIVIIGILAGIAIPLFLSQREKAAEASLKSDLKNVATQAETYFVDNQTYATFPLPTTGIDSDTTLAAGTMNVSGFCIEGTHAGAGGAEWKYDSQAGGLLEGTCS